MGREEDESSVGQGEAERAVVSGGVDGELAVRRGMDNRRERRILRKSEDFTQSRWEHNRAMWMDAL